MFPGNGVTDGGHARCDRRRRARRTPTAAVGASQPSRWRRDSFGGSFGALATIGQHDRRRAQPPRPGRPGSARRRWISAASRPGFYSSPRRSRVLFRLTGQAGGEDLVREHVNEFRGGSGGRDVDKPPGRGAQGRSRRSPCRLISANGPGQGSHARKRDGSSSPSRESIDDPSCAAISCVVIAVSSHIGRAGVCSAGAPL